MPCYEIDGLRPVVDPTAYVHPTAVLIGDVVVGSETGIWFHCHVRGDLNSIRIGARTNIQDATATFHNFLDTRVATLAFTYSFGKSTNTPQKRETGGADSEQSRAH